jgi:predicted nucleic acid-binding protein
VTRYLLDTNIFSQATKPAPSEALLGWLADQVDENLFISTLSLAEIWRGILEKVEGRRRRELEAWFSGPEGPQALFAGRILAFDEPAALIWARLLAEGTAARQPRSALDMVVAAVAEANGCVVVTSNGKHFAPVVSILNPLRAKGTRVYCGLEPSRFARVLPLLIEEGRC